MKRLEIWRFQEHADMQVQQRPRTCIRHAVLVYLPLPEHWRPNSLAAQHWSGSSALQEQQSMHGGGEDDKRGAKSGCAYLHGVRLEEHLQILSQPLILAHTC